MLKKLDTVEQFNEVLENESKFFLLKHSLTCPISQAAFQEYQKYAENHKEVSAYYLAVQNSRPLSTEIAAEFSIKHESPQAILFSGKKAVWNTSHWKITQSSLSSAANEI